MNPYEILGVSIDATLEEIKSKYKQLANIHHPDKGGDEETFKLINLAYDILSDPIKRQNFQSDGIFFTDTSIEKDAHLKIEQLFFTHLENYNPDVGNFIQILNTDVQHQKQNVRKEIDNCKRYIFKLEKIKNKIKLKEEAQNIIEAIITKKIENCNRDLIRMGRDIQVLTNVENILNNYHYGDTDWFELLANFNVHEENFKLLK